MRVLSKTIQVIYCVDTEDPLYVSLTETFKRLKEIFGIDLPACKKKLERLQKCEIDLDGLEQEVARAFHSQLLNYNEIWDQVDAMLADITSREFRQRFPDSFGQGWIYNWHCLDPDRLISN